MAKATDLGVDLMWLQRLCLQNSICTAPSWGRGAPCGSRGELGLGFWGFRGKRSPGQEGFAPRVTLGKFLKVSFALGDSLSTSW